MSSSNAPSGPSTCGSAAVRGQGPGAAGQRTCGKVCVDRIFWSLEGTGPDRAVRVTLEKHFLPASREGRLQNVDALTGFDWNRLYPVNKAEVLHQKYDMVEDLHVREYAVKLGVDIDNINMSKVNRTLFGAVLDKEGATGAGKDESAGSHFNITQTAL